MTSNHNNYDMPSTLFMTLYSLYITSPALYLCHHTHCIDDITMTVCMTSHPVYVWDFAGRKDLLNDLGVLTAFDLVPVPDIIQEGDDWWGEVIVPSPHNPFSVSGPPGSLTEVVLILGLADLLVHMALFCRLYLFTPVSFLLSSTMENRSKARLMGSGDLVLVLPESVRSRTCPFIHFVKTFFTFIFQTFTFVFLCFSFTLFIYCPHCMACGILVSWPVMEPTPPAVEAWSLIHLTTRKSLLYTLLVLSLTTGSGDWGSTLTTAAQFSVSFLHFLLVGLVPQPSYLENSSLKHLLRK